MVIDHKNLLYDQENKYTKYTKVLWCPQHDMNIAQELELTSNLEINVDIRFLNEVDNSLYKELCNCPADRKILRLLAKELADHCLDFSKVIMPIGSPAFQYEFGKTVNSDTKIIFAHSERVSEEIKQADGSIKKISVFEHIKFF